MDSRSAGRVALAATYLGGAAVNLSVAVGHPGVYESFDDYAVLGLYRAVWRDVVVPRLRTFLALVVLFEAAVGAAILRGGRAGTVGHAAGLGFQAFLVPFWFVYGLPNVALAGVHAWSLFGDADDR